MTHTSNPSIWEVRQKDGEFKTILNYIKSFGPACMSKTLYETVSQKKTKHLLLHSAIHCKPSILRIAWGMGRLEIAGWGAAGEGKGYLLVNLHFNP